MSIHKIYAETILPTVHGDLRERVYRANEDSTDNRPDPILSDYEALAIISGYLDTSKPVSVRMHSLVLHPRYSGHASAIAKNSWTAAWLLLKTTPAW